MTATPKYLFEITMGIPVSSVDKVLGLSITSGLVSQFCFLILIKGGRLWGTDILIYRDVQVCERAPHS